ncbi:CsbD family protein [Polynucleobacter sp. MG-28-Ekke-A2]|jgi:uncharacterized protein YjbJ (UPF0337 family)|uniref:CsbD family protein n=1 Tax=Polynucleobacter sp. MG-28-Ekke-A2 TaxID=3108276 RepID=UPI002B23CC91|nr:CsbD family protein [Polynucleobacter sp. MG-28-Ekke-A2]MEA9601499.1 CsbD family protein [Polynucleobacter sp. MG-28-Ekke-A2]
MNKDQVKGRVETVKGAIKEAAGNLVGNKSLETEGVVQQVVGKVQSNLGDAKSELKSKL